MIGKIEDWKEGWKGISIGLSNVEIDHFIKLLTAIRDDNEQHFHISSIPTSKSGLGGIEIYVKSEDEKDNMCFSSLAIGPGEGEI